MDKAQIQKHIEERCIDLKARILELEENTKPIAPDVSLGRLTRLDAMQLNAVSGASLENCRIELDALEQKLFSIDDPNFGLCRVCGQTINIERIKAMPESDICIVCAARC